MCLLTYLAFVSAVFLARADTRLVIPVENLKSYSVNCQVALKVSTDKAKLADPSVSVGGLDSIRQYDQELVIPYEPQCRRDRPDLFEPRQCSHYDCFCVNVTTGLAFHGTRASPSEVGDCSTAVFSLLLAIRNPSYIPGNPSLRDPDGAFLVNSLSESQNSELMNRIRLSLERILQSTAGFQRVTNITRLFSVPKSKSEVGVGLVYYNVQMISVGHSSLQAPQDLIQHRLHEGYIPDLGVVDPSISRIDLIQTKMEDAVFPQDDGARLPVLRKESVEPIDYEMASSSNAVVRNPEASPFAPARIRAPSDKVERGSRQLPGSDDSFPHLSGGFVAPPIYETPSSIHKTWPARASRVNILRQPGVIAGIVGTVVVVLLLLILLILFCIYRLRKKDEGSYALDEPKKVANPGSYHRAPTREFYA